MAAASKTGRSPHPADPRLHDSIENLTLPVMRHTEMSGAIRGGMFDVLSAQNERIEALEDRLVRAEWAAVAGVAIAGMSGVFTLVTVLLLVLRVL
jgi:hypothetical protein